MNSSGNTLSAARIKKLNDTKYIKFRLWAKHSFLTVFFICLGALIYHMIGSYIPTVFIDTVRATWFPADKYSSFIDFFAAIMYNSVDIFKISFIILIGGFTYISDVIVNISNAVFGLYMGISLGCCFDIIQRQGGNTVKTALVVAAIVLCSVALVSNCVCSALTAQKFSEYRNVNLLLTSECFWRYIGKFLISFGYILMIYTAYVLIFNL